MKIRWGLLVLVGILASIGNTLRVVADDAYVIQARGAVKLMATHPSIRMVAEQVHIQLPEGRVEARFVFHNDGPQQTVLVGFPEEGRSDKFLGKPSPLRDFRSWVDGQAVQTVRAKVTPQPDGGYQAWHVKSVVFHENQTRVIVNCYTGGIGKGGGWGPGSRQFVYILRTGSSWKGLIGHATVVCDLSRLPSGRQIHLLPEGYKRHGKQVIWERHNFKPTGNDDVLVDWLPKSRR